MEGNKENIRLKIRYKHWQRNVFRIFTNWREEMPDEEELITYFDREISPQETAERILQLRNGW